MLYGETPNSGWIGDAKHVLQMGDSQTDTERERERGDEPAISKPVKLIHN